MRVGTQHGAQVTDDLGVRARGAGTAEDEQPGEIIRSQSLRQRGHGRKTSTFFLNHHTKVKTIQEILCYYFVNN